jgi:hypothetical protein
MALLLVEGAVSCVVLLVKEISTNGYITCVVDLFSEKNLIRNLR